MIFKASAKINLHLQIGPRRSDGYHSLETIFQEISLHDMLKFSITEGPIQLTITPKGLPTNSDNLVVRALEMLREKLRLKKGMKVHLIKKIPMGAGLGGGSSDAAAALWAGWLLWTRKSKTKSRRVPKVLLQCAKKLGADVSFFLYGGLAKASGIGEKLTFLPARKKQWLILVYPRVHVSTAKAYGLLDESRKHENLSQHKSGEFFNSFERVILKKFPEIALAKEKLVKFGCSKTMMSGSGSTVFGFVKSKQEGLKVLKLLKFHPWDVFLVHTRF